MGSYGEFASIYDQLMNDFDYKEWGNYIELIFKNYNLNAKKILEMACGTGALSVHLADKRYQMVCFDLSEEMLSKAYEKLGRYKNVKLLKQDMSKFKINETFDSVIAICDSINYITNLEDLEKTFKNTYDHLNENGLFIFDINSKYKLKHIIGNNTFVEDSEDVFYTWQNSYDETEDICEFYITFFITEDGINYNRFEEEHYEKAYNLDEIILSLQKAGFSKIDYYNAFTLDPIEEKTERINFVAMK